MNIPKIIWQTYKSHDGIPKEAHMWMKSWQIQNPSWKQEFCNDQDIRQHISIHFGPRYLEVFDSFPLGVMRADFWRYCILYQFGGVYTDMDTICKQPIETWLPPHKGLVVSLESNHRCMCQWTIAASPRHPALKVLLDDIVANADNIDTSDPEFVHKTTGPKNLPRRS
jgi:inositol phosphorylceramide mannosyltransferase catalytic subunit